MNREEAKIWAPILEAYANGRTIQYKPDDSQPWSDLSNGPSFDNPIENYRIKPEPQVKPFNFDCADLIVGKAVKPKGGDYATVVLFADEEYVTLKSSSGGEVVITYDTLSKKYTFLDGSPCGDVIIE